MWSRGLNALHSSVLRGSLKILHSIGKMITSCVKLKPFICAFAQKQGFQVIPSKNYSAILREYIYRKRWSGFVNYISSFARWCRVNITKGYIWMPFLHYSLTGWDTQVYCKSSDTDIESIELIIGQYSFTPSLAFFWKVLCWRLKLSRLPISLVGPIVFYLLSGSIRSCDLFRKFKLFTLFMVRFQINFHLGRNRCA